MLKQSFRIVDGRLQECPSDEGQVLVYVKPDEAEQRLLIDRLKVDEHTLASSLDPDELARLEFEPEHAVAIFKRPRYYTAADQFHFKVLSVGAFLFKERLIVTLSEDMAIFDGAKTFTRMHSPLDVFLRMIYRSIYHFLEHLRIIHTLSDEVELSINESSDNTSLLHLFTLEKSLVYFLSAIQSNGMLIGRLRNSQARLGMTEEQLEFVDDLQIENNQCFSEAKIYSDILSGMMDARVSIVSNNLNVLMKRLAILTVIFGLLNIPASMGGMSEFTRYVVEGLQVPMGVAYALFTLGMGVLGWVCYRVLDFFQIFSVDASPTWRGRRRKLFPPTGSPPPA
jgi:magnesium transporter